MKKRRSNEDVELNVTAMLDMAFQLLAFFVLTFRPPPGEAQVYLKIPPARPVVGLKGSEEVGADANKDRNLAKTTRSVVVNLLDIGGNGAISTVQIGDPSIAPMKDVALNSLRDELRGYFKPKEGGDTGGQKSDYVNYEQMLIQSTPTVHWEDVLKVADLRTEFSTVKEEKMPAVSFATIGEDPGD